jgi:hypothetical protein
MRITTGGCCGSYRHNHRASLMSAAARGGRPAHWRASGSGRRPGPVTDGAGARAKSMCRRTKRDLARRRSARPQPCAVCRRVRRDHGRVEPASHAVGACAAASRRAAAPRGSPARGRALPRGHGSRSRMELASLPANTAALALRGRAGKPDDQNMPVLPPTTTLAEVRQAATARLPGATLRRGLLAVPPDLATAVTLALACIGAPRFRTGEPGDS